MSAIGVIEVIWRLTYQQAEEISNKGLSSPLNIYASKNGFKAGGSRLSMGEELAHDIAFGKKSNHFSPAWEVVRLSIEENRMPPPFEGVSPFARGIKKSAGGGVCVCETFDLMTCGCPSARGLKCRSA